MFGGDCCLCTVSVIVGLLVLLPFVLPYLFKKPAAEEKLGADKTGVLMKGWFSEINSQWPGQALSLEVEKVLFTKKSKFQEVMVFQSKTWGKVLVLDGAVQLTEKDEMSYQEMLAHLPMFLHPNPKDVLVIGGGDGGEVREILKHKQVQHVTMCDIDECVVQASKDFLPTMSCAFGEKRLNLKIGDGIEFCRNKDLTESFDVVIIDSSDPDGPAAGLFNKEFLSNVHRLLRPGGVVCQQSETVWLDLNLINYMKFASASLFGALEYASIQTPTYPCGQIGALIGIKQGSQKLDKSSVTKPVRSVPEDMPLKYYTARMHEAAFAVPKFVEDALSKPLEVAGDDVISMKKQISSLDK
jgi:spermidine synthase